MTSAARTMRAAGLAAAGFFMPKSQPAVLPHERAFCIQNQGNIMPTFSNEIIEDDLDDDDDDLYDDGDMLGEDEWEDYPAAQKLVADMPKGWLMVKIVNFSYRTFSEVEQWLNDNCRAKWKKVGFNSGCSYNVAVQFEDVVDATYFKLRWR